MPYSIVIVDDDSDLRTLTGIILTRAGYSVYHAADGEDAVELVKSVVPDLFLVDVMMPVMNGFELCQHLRANPQTAHLPILLLSARADRTSVETGREVGADRFLTKPIAPHVLIAQIEQCLTQAEQAQEFLVA